MDSATDGWLRDSRAKSRALVLRLRGIRPLTPTLSPGGARANGAHHTSRLGCEANTKTPHPNPLPPEGRGAGDAGPDGRGFGTSGATLLPGSRHEKRQTNGHTLECSSGGHSSYANCCRQGHSPHVRLPAPRASATASFRRHAIAAAGFLQGWSSALRPSNRSPRPSRRAPTPGTRAATPRAIEQVERPTPPGRPEPDAGPASSPSPCRRTARPAERKDPPTGRSPQRRTRTSREARHRSSRSSS